MAKASMFEKRLAALEKTITDFFRGAPAKKPAKKAKRKSAKKAVKKTARKTAKKKR